METRLCSKCEIEKPKDDNNFYRSRGKITGPCKECVKKRAKEYWQERYLLPDWKETRRKWRISSQYDMSLEEYEETASSQNYLCAICQQKAPLCVDHNHETGAIRGLLCRQCNTAIGLLKESKEFLENATAYLRKFEN